MVLNISDWLSTHCILVHSSCLKAHSYKLTVDVIVIEFTSISFPTDQQKPINFSLLANPNIRNDQHNFPLQRRKTKINSRVAHYLQGCVYTAAEAHSGLWPLHLHTPQQPSAMEGGSSSDKSSAGQIRVIEGALKQTQTFSFVSCNLPCRDRGFLNLIRRRGELSAEMKTN